MKLVALVALALFVTSFLMITGVTLFTDLNGSGLESHDYISYWAAGQLLRHHHNPYDAAAIQRMEGRSDYPTVMRNPPWSLWITLPLGFVSAINGIRLWQLMLLAALIASTFLLRSVLGSPLGTIHWLALLFGPAIYCIAYGQTSILVLLGLSAFLCFRESHPLLAGVALSFCALKPHLLVPFFTVVLAWAISRKAYTILAGAAAALSLQLALAFYLDHSAWQDYRYLMTHSGIDSEFMPTPGGVLRHLVYGAPWVQFAPMILATGWAVWYFRRHDREWDWFRHGALVLVVSVFCAPYAWLMDQSLLWPALLPLLYRAPPMRIAVLAISGGMLLQLCFGVGTHSLLDLWPALAWTALFFYERSSHQGLAVQSPAEAGP